MKRGTKKRLILRQIFFFKHPATGLYTGKPERHFFKCWQAALASQAQKEPLKVSENWREPLSADAMQRLKSLGLLDKPPAPEGVRMKYQKKPVVIEAIQWDGTWEDVSRIKEFTNGAAFERHDLDGKRSYLCIKTLEGEHIASPNDFIIKGVKGEFYPCKPDIFALTYEPAPEGGDNERP